MGSESWRVPPGAALWPHAEKRSHHWSKQQHQARGAANWAGAASTMFLHSVVSGLVKDLFLFRSFKKKKKKIMPFHLFSNLWRFSDCSLLPRLCFTPWSCQDHRQSFSRYWCMDVLLQLHAIVPPWISENLPVVSYSKGFVKHIFLCSFNCP